MVLCNCSCIFNHSIFKNGASTNDNGKSFLASNNPKSFLNWIWQRSFLLKGTKLPKKAKILLGVGPITLGNEHVSVSMSMWTRTNIFGILWWWGQNIFKISLCHAIMMWKIFFHMYMDEMSRWKWNINEFFGW